jgi:hypothetical protein
MLGNSIGSGWSGGVSVCPVERPSHVDCDDAMRLFRGMTEGRARCRTPSGLSLDQRWECPRNLCRPLGYGQLFWGSGSCGLVGTPSLDRGAGCAVGAELLLG